MSIWAGAVLGALYEKRAKQTDSSDRARIYADAFDTEHARCNEIFKTVILFRYIEAVVGGGTH